jgi:hypothetical protein
LNFTAAAKQSVYLESFYENLALQIWGKEKRETKRRWWFWCEA